MVDYRDRSVTGRLVFLQPRREELILAVTQAEEWGARAVLAAPEGGAPPYPGGYCPSWSIPVALLAPEDARALKGLVAGTPGRLEPDYEEEEPAPFPSGLLSRWGADAPSLTVEVGADFLGRESGEGLRRLTALAAAAEEIDWHPRHRWEFTNQVPVLAASVLFSPGAESAGAWLAALVERDALSPAPLVLPENWGGDFSPALRAEEVLAEWERLAREISDLAGELRRIQPRFPEDPEKDLYFRGIESLNRKIIEVSAAAAALPPMGRTAELVEALGRAAVQMEAGRDIRPLLAPHLGAARFVPAFAPAVVARAEGRTVAAPYGTGGGLPIWGPCS